MAAVRAAALLRGGVPAHRVFSLLAEESTSQAALGDIARRAGRGEPVVSVLAGQADPSWRVLAAAWMLAEEGGAPLAPALDRIGKALRDVEELREHREVLLAGPHMTVRLVCALPPLSLLLGGVLGFDPFPVLMSPGGLLLLCIGLALLGAGVRWARSLERAAGSGDRLRGIELVLAWIVLAGGAPPENVRCRVVDAVDRVGSEWIAFDRFTQSEPLVMTLEAARATGVAAGPMLLETARAARVRARTDLERTAEQLGVRVLVPLGVCVLPSFIVLGVMPVLITMLSGVGA